MVAASSPNSGGVSLVPTVYHVPGTAAVAPAATPAVASNAPIVTVDSDQQQVPPSQTASVSPTTISAANPIRPLPVGGIKKGELKPAITVAGVGITPYGFLKATLSMTVPRRAAMTSHYRVSSVIPAQPARLNFT